jgi:hypothetical protein
MPWTGAEGGLRWSRGEDPPSDLHRLPLPDSSQLVPGRGGEATVRLWAGAGLHRYVRNRLSGKWGSMQLLRPGVITVSELMHRPPPRETEGTEQQQMGWSP